jgi:hypothetical protein
MQQHKYNVTEKSKLAKQAYEEGHKILWRIDLLLGKDLETNNENSHFYAIGEQINSRF